MQRTPIQLLYNLARLKRNTASELESHYDIKPVVKLFASPDRCDLGSFAADIEHSCERARDSAPTKR
jgi:hypothetical protein